VQRLLQTSFLLIALALPAFAHAMTIQSFTFDRNSLNATWQGFGPVEVERGADAIILRSSGTGAVFTDQPLVLLPDAAVLLTTSEKPINGYFIWIYEKDELQINHSIPITIRAGNRVTTQFEIRHPSWREGPKSFGIAIPSGSTLAINGMEMITWSPAEKLGEMLASFWTLDEYRAYSINFLWGPQIGTNTIQRSQLYDFQPPQAFSGTKAVHIGLVLVLIVLAVRYWSGDRAKRKHRIICSWAMAFLCAWLLLDVRMGVEFLSWVWHDAATYITQPAGERTFRDRDRFYDFAEFAKPLVADRQSYVFFAQSVWPFLGNMRYITYPSIPGNAFDEDDTWVIYNRPDVYVGENGALMLGENQITQPGRVIGRFDDGSFVFRTINLPARKPVIRLPAGTVSR
jgi:hypothetical protein